MTERARYSIHGIPNDTLTSDVINDSTSEQPIFNRTMTLRDSWAKIGQLG